MTIINHSATAATPRNTGSATTRPVGGIFYRWHVRRERLRELTTLLAIDDHLLKDMGVSRGQVQAEIAALRHSPL